MHLGEHKIIYQIILWCLIIFNVIKIYSKYTTIKVCDTMNRKMLISLGGNAILKHTDKGTAKEQFDNTRHTSNVIVKLIEETIAGENR